LHGRRELRSRIAAGRGAAVAGNKTADRIAVVRKVVGKAAVVGKTVGKAAVVDRVAHKVADMVVAVEKVEGAARLPREESTR
jgi:hypothetical protein